MVRDDGERTFFLTLRRDPTPAADVPGSRRLSNSTALYHNLLRRWADV